MTPEEIDAINEDGLALAISTAKDWSIYDLAAAIEAATIERCAKHAETYGSALDHEIAYHIRALAKKEE